MVQTLAAAGELQRDLQRELTYDGLRAAEAKGNKGGRRPAVAARRPPTYEPRTWKAAPSPPRPRPPGQPHRRRRPPAQPHANEEDTPAPELPVTLDIPGKVADCLRTTDLEPAERAALDQGVTVRRGQGYTLRVSAVPAVHRQLLAHCQPLDGAQGVSAVPAQPKARREYENRVTRSRPKQDHSHR